MSGAVRLSFACLACLLATSTAARAAPERVGFTGDLSIGGSLMTRTVGSASGGSNAPLVEESSTVIEPGLAPLGVSLGGYVTPRIGVLFRLAGTSYFRSNSQYIQAFAGPMVEYWPHDRWFLAGGVGLGLFTPNPFFGSSLRRQREGLAFDARAGAVLAGSARHALTLSLEIIPAIYDELRAGAALLVAWKWY
ncbi:MAG TPA: hypothetical protein VIF57_11045 [Polyangia bacterium]|jgi:hypothetical protein